MRVKYIIPSNQHLDCINLKMYELLCHELQTHDKVDIVDSNPDIVHIFGTWLVTTQLMSEAFCNLYVSAIQDNEARLKHDIDRYIERMGVDDKCINDICARILYIRKRYKMQNIPYPYLTETADVMTRSNYDENLMRSTLEKMKLSKFAAFTMSLLRNKANLTEGFMPLASLDGKEVERMENVTIQQN